jgi:hypothetical protein
MRIPAVAGLIRRRILVNFRVDPAVIRLLLPSPFRPKLLGDSAMAGICLIRLEQVRPKSWPFLPGLSSENAAHRVAVLWTDDSGEEREGVYIPRRDTGSRLNHLLGGRFFPGEHHFARFDVRDQDGRIDLSLRSADGRVTVAVRGHEAEALPESSHFGSLEEASAFFAAGSAGYSATREGTRLDGLLLATKTWAVRPLEVESVHSSFFADESRFPKGSVAFDGALLMRDIPHEWHGLPDLATTGREACCPASASGA